MQEARVQNCVQKPEARSLPVLVAEDNAINQRLIGAFLKNLGTEYEIAENGQVVLDRLGEAGFSLILMDIQMPVLDGLTAIKRIRAGETPKDDIPIVVVTANAMEGDRDKYLAAGADGYLAKPLTLDALRTAISTYVDLAAAN